MGNMVGSAGSSWKCSSCGTWVPYGKGHACRIWTSAAVVAPAIDPMTQNTAALHRLAAAIEKLAEALKPDT